MRCLLVAVGLMASLPAALAADYELPTLRGTEAFVPADPACCARWSGFYAGAHLGYGVGSLDFTRSTRDPLAHMLRELALESVSRPSTWEVLGASDATGTSYGAFVGYNIGWESLILGFEVNYSRTDLATDAPISPIARVTSAGGNTYLVNITGSASMRVTEMATLRARAGFEMSSVLPYAMIAVAVGRADLARSATVWGQENPAFVCPSPGPPPCTPFLFTETEVKNGAFIYGWALGGGVDFMIFPGVFMRGEYEYVAFSPIWDIKSNVQTARLGLGLKF